ncbi:phosphoglucomutase/phosphomannomutase family protein [Erysipelothrix sp. HDW6C]|uniref:phosphoglucomutase/phosphomannomutase family protein n=1 Tax=Erysipelothrix sp. HDW6C TaxID=2714930 RepID=UPI00140D0F05|nr:phosphoglucomutase/phosphomannomutase family protein [Erysipelothrix sp. HDW6C]QIK70502.1 phosphoglucomutase/phosphomannomutase family protein [Erysipelothrix sp. HDW6C]
MIKFGTGGWRAIIADAFTKENVQILAQAVVKELSKKEIVIGFDRRFLSDIAAQWLAEVFAGNGIHVYFIKRAVPTPMIMFATESLKLDYGLAVTASHNPAIYNGIKVFTYGGRDATQEVTAVLQKNTETNDPVSVMDFETGIKEGLIEYYNPQNEYIDAVLNFVDTEAIRKAQLSVLVDTMFGVSKTSLSIILNTTRCDVDIINDRHDTLFGGKLPSPASTTLHKLSDLVRENHYDIGIATDGDADRIGIIDENGRFIHPNLLIALIYRYLLVEKGWHGPAVRNLSTTHLIDKIAAKYGQYVVETPVGFKHITEGMDESGAIIGGESSGGLTIAGHIKGKDGIFAATLLVEMIAVTGKKIGQLVNELYQEFGDLYNDERDYSFTLATRERIETLLFADRALPDFEKEVDRISYMDGLKVYFKDNSWISARFSGTEPLIRIFVESDSNRENLRLIEILEKFLDIKGN